jgi:hypothetical protein
MSSQLIEIEEHREQRIAEIERERSIQLRYNDRLGEAAICILLRWCGNCS